MTVTTAVPNVAEAVEATVASHLHPAASFDLADHPVPNGREEVWRFTPLRRLRGLFDGAPSDARLGWHANAVDGVDRREVTTAEAIALGVPAPVDRPRRWLSPTPAARCCSRWPRARNSPNRSSIELHR